MVRKPDDLSDYWENGKFWHSIYRPKRNNMLSLDSNVIVVFLIVWVLLFALTKLFFNPVRRVRDAREKAIRENKEAFEKAIESYEQSVRQVDQTLKEAKSAAENVRAALEADALKEKSRLITEIHAECGPQAD